MSIIPNPGVLRWSPEEKGNAPIVYKTQNKKQEFYKEIMQVHNKKTSNPEKYEATGTLEFFGHMLALPEDAFERKYDPIMLHVHPEEDARIYQEQCSLSLSVSHMILFVSCFSVNSSFFSKSQQQSSAEALFLPRRSVITAYRYGARRCILIFSPPFGWQLSIKPYQPNLLVLVVICSTRNLYLYSL